MRNGPEISERRRHAQEVHQARAADIVNRFTETVVKLTGVMIRETSLIKSGNLAAAAELVPMKSGLAGDYQRELGHVRDQAHWLGRTVPEHCACLKLRLAELQEALAVNLAVVGTARAVAEDAMREIFRA